MHSAIVRRVGTALAVTAACLMAPPAAVADPVPAQPVSSIVSVDREGGQSTVIHVYSASMDREIAVRVRTPADTSAPRPTLYLLNGAGGGQGVATWDAQTDVGAFFADKNVNVVTPLDGSYSYYTDWQQDDPVLGRNKWTTFLTEELPPIIDETFGTTGVNAIAGLSMSGTSVLGLAIAAPDLYEAVGAYSGCAETSTDVGKVYVRTVVESRGGGDPENMWGPYGGPGWAANDPFVNAEKLRGLDLYISAATGLPGEHDRMDSRTVDGDPEILLSQVVSGGVIEAAVNACTHRLAARLDELDIPAHFEFKPTGTHSWGYWEDDLHLSWPMIANAIGAS